MGHGPRWVSANGSGNGLGSWTRTDGSRGTTRGSQTSSAVTGSPSPSRHGRMQPVSRSGYSRPSKPSVLPDSGASLAILPRHLPSLRLRPVQGMLEVSAVLTASAIGAEDILADLQPA
jgi:hypothetical protein